MISPRPQLKIPDAVSADPDAFEILRVWIAGGAQHVSLFAEVWEDPAGWGLMLADLARHVANAYAAQGKDGVETLERVCQSFRTEMDSPTDEPIGKIVD
jgi:hypothetical protein